MTGARAWKAPPVQKREKMPAEVVFLVPMVLAAFAYAVVKTPGVWKAVAKAVVMTVV